ncbi:MAG: Crp/Fnr family transcriptional regulator [Acidobacteriota bacterium]|nr:Crp/Fnr family transcriptional regulator [Acidobacteriota bacterium]
MYRQKERSLNVIEGSPIESSPKKNSLRSTKNHILNALPDEDYQRLLPDLEYVELPHGRYIYHAEEKINYVYFPENAMISIIANTPEGQSVEVGVIGCEGAAGLSVLLGVDTSLNDALVQLPDGALRINTKVLLKEFMRAGALHNLLLRSLYNYIAQISQTALCNRLHSIEERLARWLLMCHDRSENDNLKLTQEFLSIMLGAQRASVTIAAITIQAAGYIKYSRGNIKILDREGLEDFTCGCYQIVADEIKR